MTTKKTNKVMNDKIRQSLGLGTQEPEPTQPAAHGGEGIQDQTIKHPHAEINNRIIAAARGIPPNSKIYKAGK